MITFEKTWIVFCSFFVIVFIIIRFMPLTLLFAPDPSQSGLVVDSEHTQTASVYSALDDSIIAKRPLFNVTRKPAQAVVIPAVVAKPRLVEPIVKPELMGVMSTGKGVDIAYLRFASGDAVSKVKAGDTHGRWRISSVKGAQVELVRDGKKYILELRKKFNTEVDAGK